MSEMNGMYKLPEAFIERMKNQLPNDEWEAFFAVYEKDAYKGLRANTLKITPKKLSEIFSVQKQVPWEENGFYYEGGKVGAHPYHAAGLFYSQEPSAMCAAPMLSVEPGERVLDLCSAPGGKGTRLAADLQGEGLIVLNEPIPSRAKILLQNVERMGITNAVVTCEYPDKLAERFAGYFDKIMVDAPCSGEGMFRKNAEEALTEWSEENVALCAERQSGILNCAERMLAENGKLVYSTCTFSDEEDEGQAQDFLRKHPEMSMETKEKLYPHKVEGEGHFAARFSKNGGGRCEMKPFKTVCSPAAAKVYRAFEKEVFVGFQARNLHEVNGTIYAIPDGMFDFKGLNVLRVGLKLGEVRNGRFEPEYALAMASTAKGVRNVADFTVDDARAQKYLRGETVDCDGNNGWCLVCVDGYPLGWGKRVNGTLKNHYPKGLRLHI